jgi:hypothetical protein
MGIDKEFTNQGYERSDSEAPAELWINKKAGFGFHLHWFWLKR